MTHVRNSLLLVLFVAFMFAFFFSVERSFVLGATFMII